jgi:hypothetical protein
MTKELFPLLGVVLQGRDRRRVDRHLPGLSKLRLSHNEHPRLKIDIADLQGGSLAGTQSGDGKQADEGM